MLEGIHNSQYAQDYRSGNLPSQRRMTRSISNYVNGGDKYSFSSNKKAANSDNSNNKKNKIKINTKLVGIILAATAVVGGGIAVVRSGKFKLPSFGAKAANEAAQNIEGNKKTNKILAWFREKFPKKAASEAAQEEGGFFAKLKKKFIRTPEEIEAFKAQRAQAAQERQARTAEQRAERSLSRAENKQTSKIARARNKEAKKGVFSRFIDNFRQNNLRRKIGKEQGKAQRKIDKMDRQISIAQLQSQLSDVRSEEALRVQEHKNFVLDPMLRMINGED